MAETTNEMNLPLISAGALGVTGVVNAPMAPPEFAPEMETQVDQSIAIGSPSTERSAGDITVYANSITPVTYSADAGNVAAFDIVFSVGVNCGEGVCKTYQVVKRIGIDKVKLACDAECSTPVSVVETKDAAVREEAVKQAKRFRVLAGLE